MAEAMAQSFPRPISIVRHPIYSMLLPVPTVCFIGALITDVVYLNSANLMWVNFGSWLLFAGLVFGLVIALLLLVEIFRGFRSRAIWAHLLTFYAALIAELVNIFVHGQDGWTSVAPTGLILSVIGVLLILVGGWLWRSANVELVR